MKASWFHLVNLALTQQALFNRIELFSLSYMT
jgi:hypothetical protein